MEFRLSERQRLEGNITVLRVLFFLLMLMLAIALKVAGLEYPLPQWFGWLFWSIMATMAALIATIRWLTKRREKLECPE